jgi:Coenzyme PQQ synthesis protein D (PqqD)
MKEEAMLPMRREEGLIVQELAEETVVYDQKRHKAHCLNKTAALVWRHCDGKTSPAEIATRLHAELNIPADDRVVSLALNGLQKAKLLQKPLTMANTALRFSRRDLVRKLGVASLLLPVVMTIFAPTAAAASSCCTHSCTSALNCCSGCPNCAGPTGQKTCQPD